MHYKNKSTATKGKVSFEQNDKKQDRYQQK